jgi:cytochrome c oxidase subunit 2
MLHNIKNVSNDIPEAWQMTFQDSATPVMEGIIDLHHDIMFFIILISIFVF